MTTAEDRTDSELLTVFAATNDEQAFAVLVNRYAPLVWRVCRRVLGQSADVEDAVQATFLALAKQACRGEKIRVVAPWLHRVGHNCALNLLKSHQARAQREQMFFKQSEQIEESPSLSDEQLAILHKEIDALPEKQRQAIVLCHLQGMSLQEASVTLARPAATIATWTARGRERLKNRLAIRGVLFSLGTMIALLNAEAQAAESPVNFVSATAKASALFVQGQVTTLSAGLSSTSTALAMEALRKLMFEKIRSAIGIAAMLLCLIGGSGWLVSQAFAVEHRANAEPLITTPKPLAPSAPEKGGAAPVAKKDGIPFRVIENFPVDPLMTGWQNDGRKAVTIQDIEDLQLFYRGIKNNPVYQNKEFWPTETPDKTFEKALLKHDVDLESEALVFIRDFTGPNTTIVFSPELMDGILTGKVSAKAANANGKSGRKPLIAIINTIAIVVRRDAVKKVVIELPGNTKAEAIIQQ
jgi:RNA polymerase sigma factor (sigma-70 family)